MDSNVWIAAIGVVGTLFGAFLGAWLNPYMQERREIMRLKKKLENAEPLEKFIIFNAYRNAYMPIYKMYINILPQPNFQLDLDSNKMIEKFNNSLRNLELNIRKLGSEKFIFIQDISFLEFRLALSSDFTTLINQDKEIKEILENTNKQFIKDEVYPLYEKIIKNDRIFYALKSRETQPPQQPIPPNINLIVLWDIILFLNNIGVFNTDENLSYLNFNEAKTYLSLPKREFHPEYR